LQKLLGHQQLSTTEKYYKHHSRKQQKIVDAATAKINILKPVGTAPEPPPTQLRLVKPEEVGAQPARAGKQRKQAKSA